MNKNKIVMSSKKSSIKLSVLVNKKFKTPFRMVPDTNIPNTKKAYILDLITPFLNGIVPSTVNRNMWSFRGYRVRILLDFDDINEATGGLFIEETIVSENCMILDWSHQLRTISVTVGFNI